MTDNQANLILTISSVIGNHSTTVRARHKAATKPADHSQCEHPDDEQTRTECEQQARTWDAMWTELGR